MAIFNIGKKKDEAPKAPKKERAVIVPKEAKTPKAPKVAKEVSATVGSKNFSHVLLRPRVTEKATDMRERSVYVFEIDPRMGKREVGEAMKRDYKVSAEKIRIVNLPAKKVSSGTRGGFSGATKRIKKAYVYLPKGTTIEVI